MPGGDGHTRRLRALNEQIARIDVVRHPRTMNTTETCICLPGISGWNPECPAHELFAPPTDVEHEWTNSPGRWSDAPGGAPGVPIDECTDDHSNGEHCAIHGYDDSVSAPEGFRWHRVRRHDGQIYSALVKTEA